MDQQYWQKQTDKPLFPELLWSKPENRAQAGKLLIIGGDGQGFTAPAAAYTYALQAGVGIARVILPSSLAKTVSKLFPDAQFAFSTPSGSFSKMALAEFLDTSAWANGVILAGDIGRNSETTVLLESFLEKYDGQITLVQDAADYFCLNPYTILQRPKTLYVITMGQLQKLGTATRFSRAFTSDMGLAQLVTALHEFTKRFLPMLVISHAGQYIIAVQGNITTTMQLQAKDWQIKTAARASVSWLQNKQKPLEALTSELYETTKRI